MLAFARRYLGDQGAEQDVIGELLGRWLEHPPQVREHERLSAFLAASVYHAAVDWMRRDRAARGSPPQLADPSRRDRRRKESIVEPTPDESRDALQTRLAAALDRLSSSDRLLLEAYYARALTPAECMRLLQIARPVFHQRLRRARMRLASLLRRDGDQ